MLLKNIIDEDFVNYKVPSMFIGTAFCSWKCAIEAGCDISMCQNSPLAQSPTIEYPIQKIIDRYLKNGITKAMVLGGLEIFEQFDDILALLSTLRLLGCDDDFVAYTGFYPEEVADKIELLKQYPNVIIKFGRFIPNQLSRFDEILGVTLASDNQYAVKIS